MTNRQTRFDIPLPESRGSTRDSLRGAVWLDIETTGLMPASSHVTLIGYLRAEARGRILTQIFADKPSEEEEVLARAFADWGQSPLVITYNGRHFDIPFLSRRCVAWGVPMPTLHHRDLLDDLTLLDPQRRLFSDHRLQTLMRVAGLDRSDANNGSEMVRAYRRWLERRLPEDREEILAHNADDLVRLPDLTVYVLGLLKQKIS